MFSNIYSAEIYGLECREISVEADVSNGLPAFAMVGYLSSQVREAQERVKTALKNSDFYLAPKKITINLSPADLRKSGTAFDLPIALAVLGAYGMLVTEELRRTMVLGELGLDGSVKGVRGVLPIVRYAAARGYERCLVPMENISEGSLIQGISVIGVRSLKEVISYLDGTNYIEETGIIRKIPTLQMRRREADDFKYIHGQAAVRRAAEIAAAGMHNMLMVGAPGSAKSMTAKAIAGILPELSLEEMLGISEIYSITGKLTNEAPLVNHRPFRAPHHTITAAALIGGGQFPSPGELSLAHRGVLFLDELPEFRPAVLEMLRQPMEDKAVQISRGNRHYLFPANCMIVAAMNPCKCGYFPDMNRCTCTVPEIQKYLGRVSGPFLDRMDISVEASQVEYADLMTEDEEESSASIRERITRVRNIQRMRYEGSGYFFNSELDTEGLKQHCSLGAAENKLLEQAYESLKLSARGYHRILKVARTIADLDGERRIQCQHIAEAICYRAVKQKYWK